MKTMKGFFKVVKQSEPIKVPSQKVEGGQLDKSVVTLQELGGRNTFVCSLFGSSALCRWSPGDVVFAFRGEEIFTESEGCEFMYIQFAGTRADELFIRCIGFRILHKILRELYF